MLKRNIHPILLGGAAAGVLDILAAFALRGAYGTPPTRLLQGIASGLLGPSAFEGGAATAALGLALHFLIAFVAAAVYYAASRWWTVLARRPIICGLAYGVLVHVIMNAVVLPLSRVNFRPPPWHFVAAMVVIHMLFVGLPIALTVHNQASARPALASAAGE
ncbi:MAG TPA: hypothetical protein VFO63_21870 [Blastocatellia bacterium]|nr:hypothetical protein [Blastocatellia bacterium]